MLAFRQCPGRSLLRTLLAVLIGKATGEVRGLSMYSLSRQGEMGGQICCEQASVSQASILFVFP